MNKISERMLESLPVSAIKIRRLLVVVTHCIVDLRWRDRSVKVIQYGCQMLIGYYGNILTKELCTALACTRRTASNSRKAFWLIKTIAHIKNTIEMIDNGALNDINNITAIMDTFEQILLGLYYYCENNIFFIRMGLLKFDEDYVDWWANLTWFGADTCCLIAAIIRVRNNNIERGNIKEQLKHLNANRITNTTSNDKNEETDSTSSNSTPASDVEDEKQVLIRRLDELNKKGFDLHLSLAIAVFELGVSIHYVNLLEKLIGRRLGDGPVGAMGVISSTLILYEGYLKYQRLTPAVST